MIETLKNRQYRQSGRSIASRATNLCLFAVFCLAGCSREELPAQPPKAQEFSSGPVRVTITANPELAQLDRDTFLSIKTEAPARLEIRIPSIAERLTGFKQQGFFDKEPVLRGDKIVQERVFRLIPLIAEEHRLGALAITVVDGSKQHQSWFPTRPVTFETASVLNSDASAIVGDIVGPARFMPGIRTFAAWLAGLLAIILAAAGIWLLARRALRAVKLRRMAPRERALFELSELLKLDLPGKKRVKDFYVELTMIVRRYIERAHRIKAPKLTTDEFLAAAASSPSFQQEVIQKLRDFLRSADLVKFAAFKPDSAVIDAAVAAARGYIQTDCGAEEVSDV